VLASPAEVDVTYDSLSVSEVIPARPERIYSVWLSSDEHTAFTGDKAVVEPFVGGKHSAFDGYAVGRTVDLQPGHRIVQTWRAEDFPVGSPDSRVEVTLEETVGGTMLTILHTEIPSGQGSRCRDGWLKYYLEPLKGYFVVDQRAKTNGVPKRAPKPVAKDGAKVARSTRAARAPSARRAAAKKRPANAKRPKRTKVARPKATKPKRGVKPRGSGKPRSGAKRRTRR
jgi:uncharacterized protein YndB with AHSA1/START domain